MKGNIMTEFIALEIKSPEEAALAAMINPAVKELNYEEDLYMNFLVLDYPRTGQSSIVTPEIFSEHFDHIENGPQINLKLFIK